jgi:probable F420-dependent oxidoreductase
MKVDLYCFGVPLGEMGPLALQVEQLDFDGLWLSEAKHNPYLGCAIAATATRRITVGTDIAVAFPRSPMVTAQAAWDLAAASEGRFVLGLGTQVKGHVERRFSTPFDHPVARLRDYILALRSIWSAFQGQTKLHYHGQFYSFDLLTEFFNPGPIDHPDVPVYVAGVNTRIAQMAGEVCNGFHVHPLHSARYLAEVIRPAIAEGAALAGRSVDDVTLTCPVFVAVGDSDQQQDQARQAIRRQIAFYGSTRTYQTVFEIEGWGDASGRLHRLMATGDTADMESVITDEMLDAYAVTSTWDQLPSALLRRYEGVVQRVFPYHGWQDSPEIAARWADVARRIKRPQVQP